MSVSSSSAVGENNNKDYLISQCIEYITNVGVLLIDCDRNDLKIQFRSLEKREIISTFLFEPSQSALFLQKTPKSELTRTDIEGGTSNEVKFDYYCMLEMSYRDKSDGVCFIKGDKKVFTEQLMAGKKLSSLLPVVEIKNDLNPFELLNTYICSGFEPYFSSFEKTKRNERDFKLSVISEITESLKSLKLALSQVQQAYQIPEVDVLSYVHQDVKDMVKQGATLDSLSDKITKLKNETKLIEEISKMSLNCAHEIRGLTQKAEEMNIQSVAQEINYWHSLERTLSNVDQQLKSQEITFTLNILKNTRRMQAFTALNTTGIEDVLQRAKECNSLLADLPINELLSAKDIEKMTATIAQMFTQLNKSKIYHNKDSYPMERAAKLVEALSRDVSEKLLEILRSAQIMFLNFEDFDRITKNCIDLFATLDSDIKTFTKIASDVARKRQKTAVPELSKLDHLNIQKRIEEIRNFRVQHEELRVVIEKVLPTSSFDVRETSALDQVNKAFEEFRTLENKVFDTSFEGQQTWKSAIKSYNEKIDKAESQITRKLTDQLGIAKSASEMFRIFSKFNPLFYKPKIRTAIQQYQEQLVERVKVDISKLEEKFKQHYPYSETEKMSKLRDLPSVSGFIIWARQIEKQLIAFMKRVDDVFGNGWDRMKILRKKDCLWTLNESLAEFMGVPFSKIQSKISTHPVLSLLTKPEITGTALALAFLELVYADSETQWRVMASESREILKREVEKTRLSGDVVQCTSEILKEEKIGGRHIEENNLRKEGEKFKSKLQGNIFTVLERWNSEVFEKMFKWKIFHLSNDSQVSVRGFIFEIVKNKEEKSDLRVNFDKEISTLIKEVRNLSSLDMTSRVKSEIKIVAMEASHIHPIAVSLSESIKIFKKVMKEIEDRPDVKSLASKYLNNIYDKLSEGFKLSWKSTKLDKYAKELYEDVTKFSTNIHELLLDVDKIFNFLDSLKTCKLHKTSFEAILSDIQKVIDSLALTDECSNLKSWVYNINSHTEEILLGRLNDLLKLWLTEYNSMSVSKDLGKKEEEFEEGYEKRTSQPKESPEPEEINSLFDQLGISKFKVDIKLMNRSMKVTPSVHRAKSYWASRFSLCLSWICDLHVIQSDRYDQAFALEKRKTYKYLLERVPQTLLQTVFSLISSSTKRADKYVQQWLQYQAMWEMDINYVMSEISSLDSWVQLLKDLSKSKFISDSDSYIKDFGTVVVNYRDVYEKINMKYDDTLRQMLSKFSTELKESMKSTFVILSKERTEVENARVERSTQDAIKFLTRIRALKKQFHSWESNINLFKEGEKLIHDYNCKFPEGWIFADNVEGEWNALNQIVKYKNESVKSLKDQITKNLLSDEKKLFTHIGQFAEEWKTKRPLEGTIEPLEALKQLGVLDGKLSQLKQEYKRIRKSREALDMEVIKMEKLESYEEELKNLKDVWVSIQSIWTELSDLRDIPFNSVISKTVQSKLTDLVDKIKKFNPWMLTYASVENILSQVELHLKEMAVLRCLKEEGMKERHWVELRKQIGTNWVLTELTLGDIWNSKILDHEKVIRSIIEKARGELGLEVYLKQVRDLWSTMKFEVASFNNKNYLIKSWDDITSTIMDHLKTLSSMRASPFFKTFEDECVSLESKINRMRIMCDLFMDVQRVWVYLEGVFSSNVDIRYQLPKETQRFQSVEHEFVSLMRKVHANPLCLEVVNIPNITSSLERLTEQLSKIQKSLGEYLEKQRAAFPRFYFVGDEDLLEIIGNSNDIEKLQKHLKKMFAGISTLEFTNTTVTSMISKEGEVVKFQTCLKLDPKESIQTFLVNLEREMRCTLSHLLGEASHKFYSMINNEKGLNIGELDEWIKTYPAQLITTSIQIWWTKVTEDQLSGEYDLQSVLSKIIGLLETLADMSLSTTDNVLTRKKFEHLITELVHQRDVIKQLISNQIVGSKNFSWLYNMRFYWNESCQDPAERLNISVANADFIYGFEYLGVIEKLVRTPLTDKCYLALTQALHSRFGGSPFGPAGTGKTETVKALGAQLGRFVLVFNCDETFDFKAMGRILLGLCQCGSWGCFDEFNRLNEKMMSAVSQQIQTIQTALRDRKPSIELIGRHCAVHDNTGIFITMNPGYAGRSNLPDNLKQLFRNIAMVKPDKELIAQVILYSQGFKQAEELSKKVVLFFDLCRDKLSDQSHYDFGLRALKSVLVNAGYLKRNFSSVNTLESKYLIQSIQDTIIPKLVGDDVSHLKSLISNLFPGLETVSNPLTELRQHILEICNLESYLADEKWVEKIVQLYNIQKLHHGFICVGPAASGKSSSWKVLLKALEKFDGIKGRSYIIDPKAISKDELYGRLDSTTREWSDGVFTQILRKIVDNSRGESSQRHWIIFDGDVDPEWVENLNSVLDDNKLFTLPNGERLALPENVRIMFETQDLKYATLATVSRCGMVFFNDTILCHKMIIHRYLDKLVRDCSDNQKLLLQRKVAFILRPFLLESDLIQELINFSQKQEHIMDFSMMRSLDTTFALINKGIQSVYEYNCNHLDFPISDEVLKKFITHKMVFSLLWGFSSSSNNANRKKLSQFIASVVRNIDLPRDVSLAEFEVSINDGEFSPWVRRVPQVTVDANKIFGNSIIPTLDTLRHDDLLESWIEDHKSAILCGPPGSGKSMIMTSVLKSLTNFECCYLNFSSASTPSLILKTFEQYGTIKNTPEGLVLQPNQNGKWLVVFCDEINLPSNDNYGTQRVISFIRQLVEHGGYWRPSDLSWIKLERIMFVGSCNPPTDSGRTPMSPRFLRHCPLLLVDFPEEESLKQIYGTFSKALVKNHPNLSNVTEAITNSMVEFYSTSQQYFTVEKQPHYIYSPRELSRWIRALQEGTKGIDYITVEELVRLIVHEGLRIFSDRLVLDEEKEWTDTTLDQIIRKYFTNINDSCLKRPILFSNWINKSYTSVDREDLGKFVESKLKAFSEEELDVNLVIFDSVLEHILRIDRVLKQPLGHLLLCGESGSGKTTLSRFVAWMNNFSVFQIKAHRNYSIKDFEEDLRKVLRRAGCKEEKICFIFDESNVLKPSFLEYMNSLLASGEVPGLFEGEEYSNLINMCKDSASTNNVLHLDTDEEVYQWFISQVQKNLHIIFTINPANADFKSRAATSPALFNRCVIDWFGGWPYQGLFQVASEYTLPIIRELPKGSNLQIPESLVEIHNVVCRLSSNIDKKIGKKVFISPRHYLDFIKHLVHVHKEKQREIKEQQVHIERGLKKLKETEGYVFTLQQQLKVQEKKLSEKNIQSKEKLDQIVENQKVAENRKQELLILSKQLEEKSVGINRRKEESRTQLSLVQPLLKKAQDEVKKIEPKHIQELRILNNPPITVKKTLEAVTILLSPNEWEKAAPSWTDIRKIIGSLEFITNIRTFDPETVVIPKKLRMRIQQTYLDDPSLEESKVFNASKACGPMILWVTSCVKFADIVEQIEPLKAEVNALEKESLTLKDQEKELNKIVHSLKQRIDSFTAEYTSLMKETKSIEMEMNSVKKKVNRSMSLIESLSNEASRWSSQIDSFKTQMETIIGDSIISAAFLSYSGFFDEQNRRNLIFIWSSVLSKYNIEQRDYLSIVDFLSSPQKRLHWETCKLPTDDICLENAVILERFNRFPLIIDPTGQAIEFITNYYREKKLVKTSFTDENFLKNLENSLRFGTPIMVSDAEHVDPILNPILNREVKKIAGRNIVTLGNQDIDLSPTFQLILVTRDSTHIFEPDLSSRVTFVNFSVTPSSLRGQCLSAILQHEKPEINIQRSEQIKLQGEYKVKLRSLEESLLASLSEAKGSILENESLISTLEILKEKSKEIEIKKKESEKVMETLSSTSEIYSPLASFCSSIYFTLTQLSELHYLYHFSLSLFMRTLNEVLILQEQENNNRVEFLVQSLFHEIYKRISRSLLFDDRLAFAMKLAHIKLGDNLINPEEKILFFEDLISSSGIIIEENKFKFNSLQEHMIDKLNLLPGFQGLRQHIENHFEEWKEFVVNGNQAPLCYSKSENEIQNAFREMMIFKIFKPDHLVSKMDTFVTSIFGDKFMHGKETNIGVIVEKEVDCFTPLILASVPGHDASVYIDDFAKTNQKSCSSVAMGSSESYDQADKAINTAIKSGSWVLLKNVHLSPKYLYKLEKKLHTLKCDNRINKSFRLFLSNEIHPNINLNLLRMSYTLVFEPSTGIKSSLSQTFCNLSKTRVEKQPVERTRLYLLVSWLHAVLQERLRYLPIGWSKKYEFNHTDLKSAYETIDKWVDLIAGDQTNIKPEALPWKALHSLLGESIYGGKIDNEYDAVILNSLLDELMTPESYNLTYSLPGVNSPFIGNKFDNFQSWIESLPTQQPQWIGLPTNINELVNINKANLTISQTNKIKDLSVEDTLEDLESMLNNSPKLENTGNIDVIESTIKEWIKMLPTNFNYEINAQSQVIQENSSIFKFFQRELYTIYTILELVRSDLMSVIKINNGEIKFTNYYRNLIGGLTKGIVPYSWRNKYTCLDNISVKKWIIDLVKRLEHLTEIKINIENYGRFTNNSENIWFGGLLSPEAFLTATREQSSNQQKIPLEKLHLCIVERTQQNSFALEGLLIQSAKFVEGRICVGKELNSSVAPLNLSWVSRDGGSIEEVSSIKIPIYQNSERKKIICSISVKYDENVSKNIIYQRGVAILANE